MFRDLFRNSIPNTARVFAGKNLWWHALAIVLTVAIVLSDFDWIFYEHTRSTVFYPLVYIAGIGGFLVPIVVPLSIYLYGEFRNRRRVRLMGAAMGQAELIALLATCFYKIFTGRVAPPYLGLISAPNTSQIFRFGLFRGGIFWGWPSSHAAVAFAGAVALVLMARNKSTASIMIVWAIIVGTGAAIGFHWFSDVIAGTIIGVLVGTIVAKNFAHRA